jgi:hypothetical protein
VTDTKVEQISNTEDDKDPVQVIYPAVKAKHEVSCMLVLVLVCPLLCIFHRYPELPVFLVISICLYVYTK